MFDELRNELSRHDCLDFLAKVGGLLLDPSNASRSGSLYALAHLLASISPSDNARPIPRARVVELLDKHFRPESEFAWFDDPAPQMFTEEFNFRGGPYIVFPGHIADGQDSLRWILRAAILYRDKRLDSEYFLDEVNWAAWLCLKVSNDIAAAVGLQRGIAPNNEESGEIRIPSAELLNRAAAAVTFSRTELESQIPVNMSLDQVIGPLTVSLGEVQPNPDGSHSNELFSRPFVNDGDVYVVPDPSSLMTGLRDRVLYIAEEHGVIGALADAYHSTITHEVQNLLEGWGYLPWDASLPEQPVQGFSERLYLLDYDKVLYLQVASDNLRDSAGPNQISTWNIVQLEEDLQHRNADVARHMSAFGVPEDQFMTLTILQSCRQMFINSSGLPFGDTIHLTMSASHFKAITLLDSEDHLALWKYGRSHHRVRESAAIVSIDPLDEYAFYRNSPKGYSLPDEETPFAFVMSPGAGLEIIQEAHERLDPHIVPSFETGLLTEVWRVSGDGVPISAPPFSLHMTMPVVVEGSLPLPVWVVPMGSASDWPMTIPDALVRKFAGVVWQFEELITRWIPGLTNDSRICAIHLAFDPISNWSEMIELPYVQGEAEKSQSLSSSRTEAGITIHLHPNLLRTMSDPTLLGRRVLIREFLLALQNAAYADHWSDEDVIAGDALERLIDSKLPSVQMDAVSKALQDSLLFGDPSERLPFRPVQEADTWILQEMGWRHLKCRFESKGLLKTIEDRCEVINALVEYFYGELQASVGALDGMATVMQLISCNEANIFQTEHHSVSAPALSFAASNLEEFIEELVADRETLDQASLSNRFLIEYVAVCLPEGDQPLSIDAFDRLQSLSSLICYWGGFSDYVKFGLIDDEIELRPSGRLTWNTSAHWRTSRAFMSNFTRRRIAESRRNLGTGQFESAEDVAELGELSPESRALDEAFGAEFGLTLRKLGSLIGGILNLGDEQEDSAKQLPIVDLVDSLVHNLGWGREKVTLGLELLTLTRRQDFLKPLGGRQWETYPWRYSRTWSLLRRPLVRVGCDSDSLILWGNRSLMLTLYHLDELCLSGRINASTQPLKRAVTRIRQLEAEEFEVLVSDLIGQVEGVHARPSVKKVGKLRIGRPGRDLGDIDVLGVIPELRVVLCIECKDFSLARTAAEIQHQMEEVVTGSSGEASTVEKHMARVEWVQENLDYVLQESFDIERKGCWRVKPMLVSDGEFYATYLKSLPFENWTIEGLRSAKKDELAVFV